MTDRINTQQLRDWATGHDYLHHRGRRVPGRREGLYRWEHDTDNCELCALLDIADAAHEVNLRGTHPEITGTTGDTEAIVSAAALARLRAALDRTTTQ